MININKAIRQAFGVTESRDSYGVARFTVQKPLHTAARIIQEYNDPDGIRMYECEGGKHFIADVYDKIFKPVRSAMMPRNYKGDSVFYKRSR